MAENLKVPFVFKEGENDIQHLNQNFTYVVEQLAKANARIEALENARR